MKARVKYIDGNIREISLDAVIDAGQMTVSPSDGDIKNAEYVDIGYDFICAEAGDDGYFIVPEGAHYYDSFITEFRDIGDTEFRSGGKSSFLPVFGAKTKAKSFFARAEGMKEACSIIVGVKKGKYYLYPRFCLNGDAPYEKISVVYEETGFESASYSSLAGWYRTYLLGRGVCKPISERDSEVLDYAKKSIYVRIRQAWKPVPSPVPEQTEENEPPIYAACTFDRVIDLMEECKRQGIDKAEFCLVGWNKSGHDGRWPQIFPPEPLLGGEDGLKKLLKRSKELGYRVSCHTNSSEAYSIADIYDENDLLKDKNGEYELDPQMWGGGKARKICPKKAYDTALDELPKIKKLGFDGFHYVDVIGIADLLRCYDPDHPCNQRESAECYINIAKLCGSLFGGFSSEGGRSFMVPYLDYALYVSMRPTDAGITPLASRYIPFWQLIYHGICLSNPYSLTVNVTLKGEKSRLLLNEYGGRPSFYFYSKFMTDPGKDWMGKTDMTCGSESELAESVAMMKDVYDEYNKLSYLQDCFMTEHSRKGDGKICVNYSDGSVMTVDYENKSLTVTKDGSTVYERRAEK